MAGPSSGFTNDTITYSIVVTNNGTVNQTSVNVDTLLPATLTNWSAVASDASKCLGIGGSDSGTLVICPLGTLTPGETVYITVTAVPTATGLVTSSSSVSGLVDDPDLSNNDAQVTTNVSSSFGFLQELKILVARAAHEDEFG
jgi:uncharacterized repeat protein (TIGR01451 family)